MSLIPEIITRRVRSLIAIRSLIAACTLVLISTAPAQELSPEAFAESSLTYRTALHYDPMLGPQLDSLVKLYGEAERLDELLGLYRSHIGQYPDDAGAKAVLVRLLQRIDRPGVGELIASAVPLHSEFAPLQYLLFQFLEEKGDGRALEALSKAIDLEPNPARRRDWLEELLQLSEGEAGRALAETQLRKLLEVEGQSGEALLDLSRLMQEYQFWELSRLALSAARATKLPVESGVEANVLDAKAAAELGLRAEAGKILKELLSQLAPDHWRRKEVMSTWIGVVSSEEERKAMLAGFRKTYEDNSASESAILDYAEVLLASEKQEEAAKLLSSSAGMLVSSGSLEARAIDLLETLNNLEVYKTYLVERLEADPERSDLRFRLVKIRYALGKDGDAEQDFKAVVAGLEPNDVSARILELQRFLRSIDRTDAAGRYLESYVRNHPDRLDIARELAEIYVGADKRAEVDQLISTLTVEGASVEAVLDLVEFLTEEGFFAAARLVLGAKLIEEESHFELNLRQVVVLGELGDAVNTSRLISKTREMTDTPERYSQWLTAAVAANESLETLDAFFDSEQNRFSFSDNEWPEDKVEKFVILCEIGRQRLLTDRVANAVREQLAQGTFDSKLRVRLRRFLVGVLESDVAAAAEVEEQLKLLAAEDSANQVEYDLQRALVYHRTQRVDLAEQLLVGIDLRAVTSAPLVQEAVGILIGYGFVKEAESALAALNRLIPEDVFSWEKRLSLLAALGQETTFRNVIRELRSGSAGTTLRSDSLLALEDHLVGSYWRSISRLIASGDARRFEEVLPLLASVDREAQAPSITAWTEWTRAMVLQTLGRGEDAGEAMKRLIKLATDNEFSMIEFPDGLALSVSGAPRLLEQKSGLSRTPVAGNAEFLLGNSAMRWGFEVDSGAKIEGLGRSRNHVLAIDNRGVVYAVDHQTGKLVWRESFGSRHANHTQARPGIFLPMKNTQSEEKLETALQGVKAVRPFVVEDDQFFLFQDGSLNAFSPSSGELLWSASVSLAKSGEGEPNAIPASGARPGTLLAVAEGHAAVFHPDSGSLALIDTETGKLLWEREVGDWNKGTGRLVSLNAGVRINNGLVFAYGWDSALFAAESGDTLWKFSGTAATPFPVQLRKDRGEAEALHAAVALKPPAKGESWQRGRSQDVDSVRRLIDFLSDKKSTITLSRPIEGESSLLSPAIYWAESRLQNGDPAMGNLESGYLWLMQDGSIRRISARLPVASRELPASGTFLGKIGNHVWFLNGKFLHHLDFNYNRVHRITLSDLGGYEVRAAMVGNQLVVRGDAGIKVVNALTGRIIGTGLWPADFVEYAEQFSSSRDDAFIESLWQGQVRFSKSGEPNYCVPIRDLIGDSTYVTQIGTAALICLETTVKSPEVKSAEEAVPSAAVE